MKNILPKLIILSTILISNTHLLSDEVGSKYIIKLSESKQISVVKNNVSNDFSYDCNILITGRLTTLYCSNSVLTGVASGRAISNGVCNTEKYVSFLSSGRTVEGYCD